MDTGKTMAFEQDGMILPDQWFSLFSGTLDSDIEVPMLTGSMAPVLLPGDKITIRPFGGRLFSGRHPHLGDIVVFRNGRTIVAHRLIFVLYFFGKAILVEKGDANPDAGFLKSDAIIGTVIATRRNTETVMEATPEYKKAARGQASFFLWKYILYRIPVRIIKRMTHRYV